MAAKKTASKRAPRRAKAGGRALTNWDEELAKAAQTEVAERPSMAEGVPTISTQGGEMRLNDQALPDPFRCVVVDWCLENSYFEEDFDPSAGEFNLPECYAVGLDPDEMKPGEAAPKKQADACADCWANQFGSAEKGRGKACGNRARLLLAPADKLDSLDDAEVAMIKIPPTSLKGWNKHWRGVAEAVQRPPWGVVHLIKMEKANKDAIQKTPQFEFFGKVPDKQMGTVMALRKANDGALARGYTEQQYKEASGRKQQASRRKKVNKRARAKKAPVRKKAGRGRR